MLTSSIKIETLNCIDAVVVAVAAFPAVIIGPAVVVLIAVVAAAVVNIVVAMVCCCRCDRLRFQNRLTHLDLFLKAQQKKKTFQILNRLLVFLFFSLFFPASDEVHTRTHSLVAHTHVTGI